MTTRPATTPARPPLPAPQDPASSFERADALPANSRHPGNRSRLYACARRVLPVVGFLPEPDTREGFSFREAVRRYERRLTRRSGLMFGEAAPARGVHILHAEDDALVASAVREALRGEGWRVSTCADGPSALREIEGPEPYDLLITDKQLPGADGLELVCRARELPHRQHVPVIVLSASDAEREARRAGASAFLRKPEDMPALAETVARLLARKPKPG